MSYASIVEMANSGSLRSRVTACVAQEGIDNPEQWTASNIWKIVSQPGWADDWDYTKGTYNVNNNPDTGARSDVIDDAQILAAVQAVQV